MTTHRIFKYKHMIAWKLMWFSPWFLKDMVGWNVALNAWEYLMMNASNDVIYARKYLRVFDMKWFDKISLYKVP